MPDFLERKLRREYGDNPRAIYGTMNRIGAMRGNRETGKGRDMERKHKTDVRSARKAGISVSAAGARRRRSHRRR